MTTFEVGKVYYSREEFISNEADDLGSIVYEISLWQDWILSWGYILDKNGGI